VTEYESPPGSRPGQAPEAPEKPTSRWGRQASRTYLIVCALALLAMAIETLLGHPGTGSMIAAILAAPWSMLVAGIAPPLPRDWPLAAGLAVRMAPLALFMLLNAAIVRGIAARSERDLTRTVTRVSALLLLVAPLGSGCILSTHQEVFVAAPARTFVFFNGGTDEWYYRFDLSTSPQWREQRGKIARISDLAIIGDFRNGSGTFGGIRVPLDVKMAASPDTLVSIQGGVITWGPARVDTASTKRIDWPEGARLMLANAAVLEGEIRGDGAFSLYTITTPQITLNGGTWIENLRLAAVFELK
jgi:hypothetical protein